MIELSVVNDDSSVLRAPCQTVIKIVGCGGGGSSAVNRMIAAGVSDVEFIVMNTDTQALNKSTAQKRIAIGQQLTGGLGAGGNPAVGENSAKEDSDAISDVIKGANMVIITAGMGGGTGTGSAPVVAGIAREQGALTIAVVTTPFEFEGPVRMRYAQEGLKKLRENVDSLIVIPNQQIMKIVDKKITYRQAFHLADDVLCQGVQGISEIITKPGEVNIDFADVKTVMKDQGDAILGVGIGSGENRAVDAAQKAISNPMLENRHIDGARNILVNITSAEDLSMMEVEEIVKNISASANQEHSLFWGQVLDPNMGEKISVTVIATGFEDSEEEDARDAAIQRERKENSNVFSYGDFERVVNGQGSAGVPLAKPSEESAEKPATITLQDDVPPVQAKPAAHAVPPAADLEEDIPLNIALQRAVRQNRGGLEPPPNFERNAGDLQQPAVWRNRKDLSRNINLTND